jgi:hypothetical protein
MFVSTSTFSILMNGCRITIARKEAEKWEPGWLKLSERVDFSVAMQRARAIAKERGKEYTSEGMFWFSAMKISQKSTA